MAEAVLEQEFRVMGCHGVGSELHRHLEGVP